VQFPPTAARPDPPPGPYVVAGLGRAGLAAVRRLVEQVGARAIAAWDGPASDSARAAARSLEEEGVRVAFGGDGLELLDPLPAPRCVVKSPGIPPDVPLLKAARMRGLAVIDELEFGWRLERRPVIAVTGTNGKSTVATLAAAVLRAAGARAALAGNIERGPALSGLRPSDADVVVCEVSSFQLEACPAFLPEVAVLTNLSGDHLNRHGTMRRYGSVKRSMFVRGSACVPLAVVGVGDRFGAALADDVESRGGAVHRYGTGASADYRIEACRSTVQTSWFAAATPTEPLELRTRLPGRHNALNALAAVALADALRIPRARATAAIAAARGVPGRFEAIPGSQPFDVVVDYAHNSDGVRSALETARAVIQERRGRLRVVCSMPNFRYREQRRAVARTAALLADDLVLTSERWPGSDESGVPDGLEQGAREAGRDNWNVVLDRRAAIERTLCAARPGDLVAILGRGAQDGELVDGHGRLEPFDDRCVARQALERIGRSGS